MNLLDRQMIVKLNKHWVAYDLVTVRSAVTFLCSQAPTHRGQKPLKPGFAIDFETEVDPLTGEHILTYQRAVEWDEWVTLPVREHDLWIGVGRSAGNPDGRIRIPMVVICANYDKVPLRTTRWSAGNVHKRDNYTCAYTQRKLSRGEATVDHINPRSRGGRDTWENTVTCARDVNTMKANRTPEEAGLVLKVKPKAPKATVKVLTVADACHPSQRPFLL